ncbi:MAG: hypothetical protein [Bacteriophage sp.]|nr:MAG: hypothetical protein [Bacteriophage sp.]
MNETPEDIAYAFFLGADFDPESAMTYAKGIVDALYDHLKDNS